MWRSSGPVEMRVDDVVSCFMLCYVDGSVGPFDPESGPMLLRLEVVGMDHPLWVWEP